MRRREFVTAVVSAIAAPEFLLGQQANPAPPPPAPVPWTLGLNPSTPIPQTEVADALVQAEVRFFTPAQMATLERLSDLLMPAMGDKPGAMAAETPAFIDFLIGSSLPDRKQMYQGGLDWLDGEAKKKYSRPFAQVDATQADALLRPWLRTWMADNPPTEAHADFINIAHADIRTATVNSKAWSDATPRSTQANTRAAGTGLYWFPIEPDVHTGGPARSTFQTIRASR